MANKMTYKRATISFFRAYWWFYPVLAAVMALSAFTTGMPFDQAWRILALVMVFTASTILDIVSKMEEPR